MFCFGINQFLFPDAFSVKPDSSVLSIRYVYHILLKNQNWIYSLKKGVGVPHVYPKDLADVKYTYSLSRQRQEIH
jgi:hypothetical protein